MNKGGKLVIEGDKIRFFTNIGRAAAGDGLPLTVATIILSCSFSMLFSDFSAHHSISIPIPPIMALTEFFHADAETNFHPLPVSWYFISSLWRYPCSCMHIMSMIWSITEAVSSGSWSILFKVLMLNVAICIVLLHFNNFCFSLSSVSWFFEQWGQGSNPSRTHPFFTCAKSNVVWTSGLSMSFYMFLFSSIEATLIDKQ